MARVSLPEFPEGKEFEEYISAILQVGGYYIERNIIYRKVSDLLELDIIKTDYTSDLPNIDVIEVKSKGWGFHDLFKVRGWMDYLEVPDTASLITLEERRDITTVVEVARKLDIEFICIQKLSETERVLSDLMINKQLDAVDIITWRYSYWLERVLLRDLWYKKRHYRGQKRFGALADYYFKVNSSLFFVVSVVERISQLYAAFQAYPLISAKCGHEMIGEPFEEEHERLPDQIYNETFYDCNYNDIQISTFIEHRARLAILKNAIDYLLYKDGGNSKRSRDSLKLKSGGQVFKISMLSMLPSSFCEGLEQVSKHTYFYRYPIFWQWFMWLFGGFILKDKEEQEYAILSSKTGIPVDEIPRALQSYELLFPSAEGWFMDLPSDSNVRIMRMFPVAFMGIGANYRRMIYTKDWKFNELSLTGGFTLTDLRRWNNLVVEVLKH